MRRFIPYVVLSALLATMALPANSHCLEISSRYATIQYANDELLREFNNEIVMGNLSYVMRYKKSITWQDEVKNKVDVIVERVVAVLEMRPKDIHFKLVLLPSEAEVQKVFKETYHKKVDFIAFYSPKEKTVYISVRDVRIGVFAHEIGHLIVDLYYGAATPIKIHELLAQ